MSNSYKISYFHKVMGPRGPVPNALGFSFDDLIREFAPEKTATTVPIGKFQFNSFLGSEPRLRIRHLSITQQDLAERDSAWIYEISTSQGFLNHTELAQDEFWGSLWSSVPERAQEAIRNGAMDFFVTSLPEDSTPRSIVKILGSLIASKAPLKNIAICSSGLYSEKAKKEIYRQTGSMIRTVPWFECNVLCDAENGNRTTRQSPLHSSLQPRRRFTLLNRRINNTPHRVALFLALLERQLDSLGHISMPWIDLSNSQYTFRDRIEDLLSFPENANRKRLMEFGFDYFKDGPRQLPLKLDVDFSSNWERHFKTQDHYSKTLHQYFDDSYFSVIPECHHVYGGEDELDAPAMISEKTFFAMRNFHPFVIMGEPYTLNRLRDYGYQTFSKWIDESYDQVLNTVDRAVAVAKVVEDLCKMPEPELRKMILDMEPTLRHNHTQVQARVDLAVENAGKLIERQLLRR